MSESLGPMRCGGCGNNTYHSQFNADGDHWAECTECGRPTSAVGAGSKKQESWEGT